MQTIRYTKMDRTQIINAMIKGGILAFPTDTVFGLGSICEKEAMLKVYEAKGRSFDKPLPMMCDSLEMIERYAYVSEDAKKIIEKFVPGPLTIIFRKREEVGSYVTNGKDTIGIRVPDDEWILSIIKDIGKPLMVTSANISGAGSLLKWQDVLDEMDGKIDGIVMEDARGDAASTIIDVTDGIKILREGPISLEEIEGALNE